MSIGNPIFLWGLPAVAFPVLLHLFYRRRKTHVSFSTVQFFRQRQRYLAHRRRLRELLLLLLRTLALLFLVLALARPLFQHLPFAVAARTDVVIVLDDTLSMGRKTGSGKTAYDLARRKAADIIASLRSGDGAALVWMSGRNGAGITRRRQQVKQSIDGLSASKLVEVRILRQVQEREGQPPESADEVRPGRRPSVLGRVRRRPVGPGRRLRRNPSRA